MDFGHMQRPLGMRDQNELADLNEIPVPRIIVNYQPNICLRSDSTAKPFTHCVCICEIPRTCVSEKKDFIVGTFKCNKEGEGGPSKLIRI